MVRCGAGKGGAGGALQEVKDGTVMEVGGSLSPAWINLSYCLRYIDCKFLGRPCPPDSHTYIHSLTSEGPDFIRSL